MAAWIAALGFVAIVGIWFAAHRRGKLRRLRQRSPQRVTGPLADLRAWRQEQSSKPEMIPWYGWRRELRLALRHENSFAGLVVILFILFLACYGIWNLFR